MAGLDVDGHDATVAAQVRKSGGDCLPIWGPRGSGEENRHKQLGRLARGDLAYITSIFIGDVDPTLSRIGVVSPYEGEALPVRRKTDRPVYPFKHLNRRSAQHG